MPPAALVELSPRTLEAQREEFRRRRLLAMPIAGTIAWTAVGIAAFMLPPRLLSLFLYVAMGSIFYLAVGLSRLTGENLLDKRRPKNSFDSLFLCVTAMAWLAFAIAIPFAQIDRTSLPLTLGILTGMMWLPLSWIIQHWIGWFHALSRTVLIVLLWYQVPEHRFIAIPFGIVAIYLFSIAVLEHRWRKMHMDRQVQGILQNI